MKISEFQSICTYDCSDLQEFKICHPKQIISTEIPVPIWKVTYKYTTARGNQKTATKYIILDENAWDRVENEFHNYILDMNERYPERKLSNVEILDEIFLGNVYIPLE